MNRLKQEETNIRDPPDREIWHSITFERLGASVPDGTYYWNSLATGEIKDKTENNAIGCKESSLF